MDRVRYLSFSGASPFPLLIRQHAAIVEALARRKRLAAENAMRRHLREILTALPAIAAEHPLQPRRERDSHDNRADPLHRHLSRPGIS